MTLTLPSSTVDDQASRRLPAAKLRSLQEGPFDSDQFVKIEDVPVFREHTTRRPGRMGENGGIEEGEEIHFGPNELQLIAECCNRRIESTGDYAVLSLGHTPTDEQKAAGVPDPPVIGFAGPFRLGKIGPPEKESYVILCTHWVYRDRIDDYRRHPRRSPEVWMEQDFADMFLDPIALLGAEVPRLDMGLVYSRVRNADGREVLKYSSAAAVPGPSNVALPTEVAKPEQYQTEESGMSLSNEDLEQIVEAFMEMPVIQYMQAKMSEEQGAGEAGAAAASPEAPGSGTPEPAAAEAAEPAPPIAETAGADPIAPPQASPAEGPAEPSDEEQYARYAAMSCGEMSDEELDHYAAMRRHRRMQYQAGDEEVDDLATEDIKQYTASGSVGGPDAAPIASATIDGAGVVDGSQTVPGGSQAGKDNYQRQGGSLTAMQYAKVQQRHEQELARYQKQLGELKGQVADSRRKAALQDLQADGYIFNLGNEVERCRYGRMGDPQFKDHCEAIRANYQRVPIGGALPDGLLDAAEAATPQQEDAVSYARDNERRERYAKEAAAICLKEINSGKHPDYEKVLSELVAGSAVPPA